LSFDEYVPSLTLDDHRLMADGYPAEWDLATDCIDERTKNFVKLAVKNPKILDLQKRLDLTLVA